MKIVVLGDIHFPFHNERALKKALALIKKEKPTHVVQIGDLYDQYAFSRFSRKNIMLPDEELGRARASACQMWSTIRKSVPGVRCYQILGNHDLRLIKRAQERLPEAQDLVTESVLELYRFEKVTTVEDDREELILSNILFHHGYRSKLGDHMKFNSQNTVVGHSHTGGVVFEQRDGRIIWELNAGYLADESAEPLKYRPQRTSKWTLGIGIIDKHGPRFVPL